MRIELPAKVNSIIHTLQENGFEAYAVGGCVRDSILRRTPQDWDITTSAAPEDTKRLFGRTIDTGIEHGTVTVLLDKEGFEVTTYRLDGEYQDCRHPKEVQFTRSLQEDLLRRDFTINAMAYNEKDGLVDMFGGMADLKGKVIRCVGCADARLKEDALRILRAVRFAAQLGFAIEDETKKAIRLLAGNLSRISAERIQAELVKLLLSPHPDRIRDAFDLGITRVILPEFDRMMETEQETVHHCYNVGEHTIQVLLHVRKDKLLRLSALLHDTGKPCVKTIDQKGTAHFKGHGQKSEELAKAILKRLKFDNETLRKVCCLVRHHDDYYQTKATPENVRRTMHAVGKELFPYYVELRRADVMGQSGYLREKKLKNIEQMEEYYEGILSRGECVSLKGLAITGRDLLDAGIPSGPRIGETLNRLLEMVLTDPEKNRREILLKELYQ